jgi:hypothetical protein
MMGGSAPRSGRLIQWPFSETGDAAALNPTVRLVFAMAYQRADRPAEARQELQRVRNAVEQSGFDPWREGDLPFVWWDWLRLHLLLHEAEGLILDAPIFPADPFAR